ncbi:helix-turn-helix domain-containing protein [uncultured Tateyamaria sp.]|uniref:helix-turn-helix domain-containing protein n=1 Tax=uncultured Tateyamaria sp. TaxID=455651 RepID=UPI00260958CA|nr:helix-turn-helix domain-containing protein [uncultured Tateyamaria sp.]
MTTPAPIHTRMFQVQERYGVSEWTVRRWAAQGLIAIHKRGNMSFVRHEEMQQVLEAGCAA